MSVQFDLTPKPSSGRGVAHCYACGRFSAATTRRQYNGWFNCLYITTHCKRCGDIEVNET